MAKAKKEFEIKINGISQNIEAVAKLVDVLNQLEARIQTANTISQENKEKTDNQQAAIAQLEKSIKDVQIGQNELNKEQAEGNKTLDEAKNKTVEATQEQEKSVISLKGMKDQLKELKEEWEKTDIGSEKFKNLGEDIANVSELIKKIEERTKDINKLDTSLKVVSERGDALSDIFGSSAAVLETFGIKSKGLTETINNLKKVMDLVSNAQKINNAITKLSTSLSLENTKAEKSKTLQTALSTKAEKEKTGATVAATTATAASTVATTASSVAMKIFSKAIAATGIGAVVTLLGLLISNFDEIKKVLFNTFPALEGMGEHFDKVKEIAAGLGEAIINYVLIPFRTVAAVVKKLLEGDIIGAVKAGFEELKNGYNLVDNYEKGREKQALKNEQNKRKKDLENNVKSLEEKIKNNEAKYGSDWKYTEQARILQQVLFMNKLVLYKDDKVAYAELMRDKMKADREFNEFHEKESQKQANEAQRQADARKQALENYLRSLKTFQDETHRLDINNQQKTIDREKKTAQELVATTEDELAKKNDAIEESYKKQGELNEIMAQEQIKQIEKTYQELIEIAKKANQNTTALEAERLDRLKQMRIIFSDQEVALDEEKNKKIKDAKEKYETDQEAKEAETLRIQKKWAALSIEEADKQFRTIQDLQKKAIVHSKSGAKLIDIDATRDNYEQIKETLNKYIETITEAKKKEDVLHNESLNKLKQGTIQYQEEQNRHADAVYALNNKLEKANKEKEENTKKTTDVVRSYWAEVSKSISDNVTQIAAGITNITQTVSMAFQAQLDEIKEKYKEASDQYTEVENKRKTSVEKIKNFEEQIREAQGGTALALQEQMAREIENKTDLEREEKRLAKEKEKREKEIAKKEKQIKRSNMVSSIATAVANVAQSVTKMWTAGPILGPILAGLAAAMGAVQVGIMTKQLSKMEDGGLLKGPSHANGGMRILGTNIEVEGGEYVINKHSTARNKELIEYINNSETAVSARDIANMQGIPLGNNGISPDIQLSETYTANDKILKAIENINIRPVVSVKDINAVGKNMVDVSDIAGIS